MHVLKEFLTLEKLVSEVKWWDGQKAAHGDKPGALRHAGQSGEGDLTGQRTWQSSQVESAPKAEDAVAASTGKWLLPSYSQLRSLKCNDE